jgi:hypothetical protein
MLDALSFVARPMDMAVSPWQQPLFKRGTPIAASSWRQVLTSSTALGLCSDAVSAGYGPLSSTVDTVHDVDALVREMTPAAFFGPGNSVAGSSQALVADGRNLGACGVLLVAVTPGFGGSELQLRSLHTVLAAAAAAGGAPV